MPTEKIKKDGKGMSKYAGIKLGQGFAGKAQGTKHTPKSAKRK